MDEVEAGVPSEPPSGLIPRRRWWPLVLIAVIVIGGAAAALILIRPKPDPMTVLIAVELDGGWWEGSKPSALIADQVAERLEALGFSPLKSGDPKVTQTLEDASSPAEAARKLGAAFVIGGALTPRINELPVEGGYFETRLNSPIHVQYLGEEPVEAGPLSSWSGSTEKERALTLLAQSVGDQVFDAALPVIMQHAAIGELGSGPAAEKARISLAKAYVQLRDKELSTAKSRYDGLRDDRKKQERGRFDPDYRTAFDQSASLCAVTKRGILMHVNRWRPFFSPGNNELGYRGDLERLIWLGPDGKEQEIYRGYNVYSYPGADLDGKRVVFIEDLYGWARAVTLLEGAGEPKRLMIERTRWLSEPKPSPDGSAVAFWDRGCRRCPARLTVLSLPKGEPLYSGADGESALGGFAWVGPKRLVLLERPPPDATKNPDGAEGEQRLVEIDVSTDPIGLEVLHVSVAGESYGAPAASGDGRYIVMERYGLDTMNLAVFDREEKRISVYGTGRRTSRPALSPDGTRVAFELGRDIALFDLGESKLTRLTQNAFDERYPQFSLDGKTVLFESRDKDPTFPSKAISVIAAVKKP